MTQETYLPHDDEHHVKRVVVATSNPGKVREIAEALSGLGWQLESLPAGIDMPEETGSSYEENASLKACTIATRLSLPALADDSGLEVDALDGQPGVYSARFGNLDTDNERNAHLLDKLRGQGNRRARFRSVVILAYPDGDIECYEGEVAGNLLEGPRGQGGFGYDPLFVPEGEDRTLAEMSVEEKRAISHRGVALKKLLEAHSG
ncbi:RdgB/HAM1 family non-canonical purine NTP pyrophosphatase [Deinococcus radiophilus]|uniref:dITP/XTP pyrophosphatase n=1 Tax=Deinococcus radiophilus TaxID=32062 RepID=A0A3S0L4V7_9DEIO|nr:RdgB/HAM1 family non-canonical purine NTP pyrophosphatase [Deinococcus radiophilus]RTR27095.1 RdgB/HAM1 family non-canonical purine NTP pyrophosphatase [Deinococcus radiophilus]UFA50121.1 RdgB/HAM1 family non-canonical purine NTP pyrophosphatase [Deinococcus radiophilus]